MNVSVIFTLLRDARFSILSLISGILRNCGDKMNNLLARGIDVRVTYASIPELA